MSFSRESLSSGESSRQSTLKWGRVFVVATLLVCMVGTVSAQVTQSESFTDNDIDPFVNNLNQLSVDSTLGQDDSYSLKADVEDTEPGGTWTFSQSTKLQHIEWYHRETSNQQNGFLVIENGNGEVMCGAGTNNPTHDVISPTATDNFEQIGSSDYQIWTQVEIGFDYDSNECVYNMSDSVSTQTNIRRDMLHTGTPDRIQIEDHFFDETNNNPKDMWFDNFVLQFTDPNSDPSIDSVSTSPSSWTLGSSVNVSADVSDSDGTVQSVKADVWEDGTQIVSDASLSDSDGDGTWEIDNLFNVDESDVYYNLTLTAEDDDGATSTFEEDQFIQDKKPVYTIEKPDSEEFTYTPDYRIQTQDDGDNVKNEQISCTVESGLTREDKSVVEGKSFSGELMTGLGKHDFNVSCTEQDGVANTKNKSKIYEVIDFKVKDLTSQSQVYETENISYTLDYRTGDMINQDKTNVTLYWNNSQKTVPITFSPSTTGSETIYREIPLIQNNDTDFNYSIEAAYNKTLFISTGSNSGIASKKTQNQTQNVLYNYYFDKHSLKNGFTQLEASTLNYSSQIVEKIKNSDTNISVEHSFNQTQTRKTGKKINKTSYYNLFDSNLVNKTSQTFKLSAEYSLSFKGDSRTFSDTKNLQLDKIILNKTSTGPETLKFETRDELNNSLVNGKVEAGIQVNNPDQADKTRFYGFSFNKDKTHSIYLQPSYADVNANVFNKRSIEYLNTDSNYPKRRYYLLDTLLDNETTNINLYMLQESKGAQVQLELFNSDLKPLENHLIRVERAFPDKEETKTVALVKTGSEGLGSTFLQLDEQYIFTIFNSDGELLDQIGPQSVTTTRKTLEVEDDVPPSFANAVKQVKFTSIQENKNDVSVSYISETDRLNNIYLSVYQDDLFSTQLISSDSSEQVQGSLEAAGFNASNERVFYELTGTFGETNITLQTGSYGTPTNDYGDAGIFVSFMMFMALTLSGLFRPSAAIGLGVVSIFVMAFTGLLAVGQTALISLAALAAVLIWRMSS
jgi:hypothetical protein